MREQGSYSGEGLCQPFGKLLCEIFLEVYVKRKESETIHLQMVGGVVKAEKLQLYHKRWVVQCSTKWVRRKEESRGIWQEKSTLLSVHELVGG